ncbi:MAG: SDR family oxidoreductase, partial [Acidimicrobiia bacterium]|nr:SDR family oxidoreductase [Acidimicrobiia bacterium]
PFGEAGVAALDGSGPFDAAVWAQGTNCNDTVADTDYDHHVEVLQANLLFVTRTLQHLLAHGGLRDGARLCVISSIWETAVRPNKFSYTVSKAALGGFVRSAAVDLAPRGMLVNAVLPGVLDTPMTRDVLTPEQIRSFEEATGFGRLVSLDDVANAVSSLVSAANTGITGQSIAVDLGYSNVHVL